MCIRDRYTRQLEKLENECDEALKQIENQMYAKQLEEDYDEAVSYTHLDVYKRQDNMPRGLNYDNKILSIVNVAVYMLILGIFWFVTSIPLVTIGASTTAVYYTVNKLSLIHI